MTRAWLLRFHRWLTLVFAVPLLVIIVTGLILSFEPLAQQARLESPLSAERLQSLLVQHDPEGKATGLTIRSYENSLTLAGVGPEGETEIDLSTGQIMADDGTTSWSEWFRTARTLHEHLIYDLGWLVTASTIAMLLLALLGVLMGWPRIRNTLGGWHQGAAWFALPLVILSPLTGLAIAYGISFTPPATGARPERLPIREAVAKLGEAGDITGLTSLRTRGGRLVARIFDGGQLASFQVSRSGVERLPTNWPRALHEGNWSGLIGPALNIIVSLVLVGLWFTGLWIWARRKYRQMKIRAMRPAELPAE